MWCLLSHLLNVLPTGHLQVYMASLNMEPPSWATFSKSLQLQRSRLV